MKKACLYIIFFILLLNHTSLNQLFKLPALISHYLEHHGLNNKVGVVEFLSMHYWGTDLNDNDQDKDMKLPFKKVDASSIYSVAIPIAKTTIEKQHVYTHLVSQSTLHNLNLTNPALSSLFRPPRA